MMSNWYTGNFDWKNPRNQYEQTLMKMRRPQTRSRSKSRSRSRSKPRSRSKSRSRSRSRSKSRKRTPTPRPRKQIYAITRAQQRRIDQGINQGTRIRQSQIPTQIPGITLSSPPRMQIRTGSQGEMIGSPFSSIVISPRQSRTSSTSTQSSSQPSRIYSSNQSGYNTPRQSQRSQNGSRVSSLTPSRQISPIPPQSSRSSSEQQSSQGPQIVPIWKANAGFVINGEINGIRLQVIFSTIHKTDFMTRSTARRCGFTGTVQLQQNHYLENTYFDHSYSQQTRNPVNIKIGEDPNNNDLYITTEDRVTIVDDNNFYNRSQSLQNPRNRLYVLIGLDTIEHNGLIIKLKELVILFPNPNFMPNPEKKYYKIKAMQYPDLSIQTNRDFHVSTIEKKNIPIVKNLD